VTTESITVTGTTAPRALVAAEAAGPSGGTAATASAVADRSGHWSLTLTPTTFGSPTITVSATKGNSTGYAQESVTDVTLPGTPALTITDPAGDDNGPGTYQYPTSSNFTAGSFDLTGFRVSQTATDVYLQVSLRDLAATFGSNFGAQMLDIYARDPSVASSSTSSAIPQENYTIASGGAWTERVEAQGFAPVQWVNAANASLGSAQLIADPPSGTATIVLPRTAFGTVGSGWVFTLALTGQDGTNSTQLRAFTQPGQDFTFGVCAPGGTSPICKVDPNTVPKVMDTIPPAGVDQATELNPLNGPVQLQGVTVP
jgi:glucoamylase